ncbi:hypothetical protein [Streptomyces sp. NPDC001315]|uniref:hypothetical protein n=1 Tax=Streptomyces sp. NPDC001315 TaxID=3364562 RepID=UPI00369AFA65
MSCTATARRPVRRAFTPGRVDRFAALAGQRARALLTGAVERASRFQLRVLHREALRLLPALRTACPPRRPVSSFINGIKSPPVRVT